MLTSFDLNIHFSRSKDYYKCEILLYSFTLVALVHTSFSKAFILLGFFAVAVSLLFHTLQFITTVGSHHQLAYRAGRWILTSEQGIVEYGTARVSFDGGFFLFFTLINAKNRKKLMIFKDQITPNQQRMLVLICKMSA